MFAGGQVLLAGRDERTYESARWTGQVFGFSPMMMSLLAGDNYSRDKRFDRTTPESRGGLAVNGGRPRARAAATGEVFRGRTQAFTQSRLCHELSGGPRTVQGILRFAGSM